MRAQLIWVAAFLKCAFTLSSHTCSFAVLLWRQQLEHKHIAFAYPARKPVWKFFDCTRHSPGLAFLHLDANSIHVYYSCRPHMNDRMSLCFQLQAPRWLLTSGCCLHAVGLLLCVIPADTVAPVE